MTRTVSVHSFRGGTGKSNMTANIAAITARRGKRVAVIDADIQSPGIHVLFGLDEQKVTRSLNDFLWDRCTIEESAMDVTPASVRAAGGEIQLIASSLRSGEIARVLREGYDVNKMIDGIRSLNEKLELDYLFIDTHPGLNEETLLSIAISNALVVILRPDNQDYQGTAVTVELARRLEVAELLLLLNKVPPAFDAQAISEKVSKAYGAPVAAALPLSQEMLQLASAGVFALHFPDHPLSQSIAAAAALIAP